MRRALLGLERAAEESAAERDRVRPRLREVFLAWGGVYSDGLRKREGRAREAGERERYAAEIFFELVRLPRRTKIGVRPFGRERVERGG